MSSLADLPHLDGFFTYSREDDEGSNRALSALREAIQNELSAQLGRTHKDFRIWQDKSAISLGTLWEKQISQGINESVFFIPIITPRALRSQHCAYEFQAFLARESELGRDDLVFPILYIPVPALEDEKLWRDEPILRIVATRQYLDWRELRHHDPRSLEVQQKLEWYCRGITNALHKTWIPPISPKLLKRDEPEAAGTNLHLSADAPRRAEQGELAGKGETPQPVSRGTKPRASRRATRSAREAEGISSHLSADALRRAEPDELAGKGETPQPVPEERSREQAAEQPVRREPVLAAVKPRVGVLVAAALAIVLIGGSVTAWLALGPSANTKSRMAATAPSPTLAPLPNVGTPATPTQMSSATSTNAPTPPLAPVAPAPVPPAASGPAPDEVAWTLIQDTNDAGALRRFVAQFPDSARRKDAERHLASISAAQTAWNSVKDSKDPDQLRQFVRQFPDSLQRNDAETRLDSLLAAQAAWNSVRDSKDPDQLRQFIQRFPDSALRNDAQARLDSVLAAQTAWNSAKDSKDPDKLRQFVLQFPDSSERPIAEQRIASLVATLQSQTVVAPPDPHELTRSLQVELQRVGCFNGAVNGEFDDGTKAAWHRFIKLTSISMPDDVSSNAINAVHGTQRRVCPLVCPHGKHAEGEVCVANAPLSKTATPPPKAAATKAAAPKAATARATSAPRAAAPSAQDKQYNCHGTMASLSGSAMSRETCGY
jgi:predicted negative regulator of RcsB-dependent stress response